MISKFKFSLYRVARFRTVRAAWRELVLKKEKAVIQNKQEITWNILVFQFGCGQDSTFPASVATEATREKLVRLLCVCGRSVVMRERTTGDRGSRVHTTYLLLVACVHRGSDLVEAKFYKLT